ncbi:glycosyltransferase [Mesorhizobium marinum]|uniref:glycosyltransferase n=1 Tax=Mesorhizobium marinum TaxID=3228790 RepID=UPI003466D588
MRVLHFYKTYYPDSFGGAETAINDIARSTARYGVESEVLSLSRTPAESTMRIDGHWARKARLHLEVASTGLSLSVLGEFARMATGFDIIHYHFPWPMMDVAHFLAGIRSATVVTYHSDIVRQKRLLALYKPLMYRFLDGIDHIVATSPNYLQSSAVLQRFREKVSVIPLCVRPVSRAPTLAAAADGWRRRLGGRFFLFLGALRYYKGLPYLIDAAARTGYPVAIAGDGEMASYLEREVRRRRLANVHLLGAQTEDEKHALLEACHAFVFPSHLRSEAFGIALLEAAEFGRPLISCEIGTGTSYVNVDGETGRVVPPADPEALAAAMTELWHDEELAADMGMRARQRYHAHFTVEVAGEAYASLYRRLLRSRTSNGA